MIKLQKQIFEDCIFPETNEIDVKNDVSSNVVTQKNVDTKNKKFNNDVIDCFTNIINKFDYTTIITILKNHHNMRSSEFDKSVLVFFINTFNNFITKIDNDVINTLNNVIKTGKLLKTDILNILLHNLDLIFKNIHQNTIVLLENIINFNGKNSARLFLNVLSNEFKHQLPLIGQVLLIFDITTYLVNIFSKRKIVNRSIQGFEIPVEITAKLHASFKRIGHKYKAHVVLEIFDINTTSSNHNNSEESIQEVLNKVTNEIKDNAYVCTGIPYEVYFKDDPFNDPKTFYEIYKNMKFLENLLNNWFEFNKLSIEDINKINAYLNYNSDDTYWNRHKHENPISFLYNYLYGKDYKMSDAEYLKILEDIRKGQTNETKKMEEILKIVNEMIRIKE